VRRLAPVCLALLAHSAPRPQLAAQEPSDSLVTLEPAASDSSAPRAARAPTDTLTLDAAVRTALARSPALREAEGARIGAKAARFDSWGRLVPSLTLTTGFTQSDVLQRTAADPITGAIVELPDSLIAAQETWETVAVLDASWTLFDGGRTFWEVRKAGAESAAADLAYDAARARVAAGATLAYLDALEAVALEEARRVQLEHARELARLAAERFRVGEVPQLDDLQARLAESDAEIALLEAESATDAARLQLFEHLGLAASARVALVEPAAASEGWSWDEDELRRRALEGSTEIASLEEARTAAARGLDAERWWFLPSVTLGATWVRSEFGQTRDAFTFEPRNEQTFYTLGLSWSPFDSPASLISDRRRARAALWTAEGRLAARHASLAREVEVAIGRLRRARLLEEKSALNVDLAARQREQASERYRLGLAPIVERMNAQALFAEAERQAIAARYATLRAAAELERAAGIRLTGLGAAVAGAQRGTRAGD
jgi:outer membrane protein TolC